MYIWLIQRIHIHTPAPVLNAGWIDALYAVCFMRSHHPCGVCCGFLDVPFLEVAHNEPVIAKYQISAHVQDWCVANLFMCMSCFHRRYSRFKDRGVPHLCIIITLNVHRRHCIPATAVSDVRFLCHPFIAVLRTHHPSSVHLCAGDMGMRVNTPWHYSLTLGINHFCIPQTAAFEFIYDLT